MGLWVDSRYIKIGSLAVGQDGHVLRRRKFPARELWEVDSAWGEKDHWMTKWGVIVRFPDQQWCRCTVN